jgi:hypothetical protein
MARGIETLYRKSQNIETGISNNQQCNSRSLCWRLVGVLLSTTPYVEQTDHRSVGHLVALSSPGMVNARRRHRGSRNRSRARNRRLQNRKSALGGSASRSIVGYGCGSNSPLSWLGQKRRSLAWLNQNSGGCHGGGIGGYHQATTGRFDQSAGYHNSNNSSNNNPACDSYPQDGVVDNGAIVAIVAIVIFCIALLVMSTTYVTLYCLGQL